MARKATMDLEGFLRRVTRLLQERGLSRAELSKRLGLSSGAVTEWWSRGRMPSADSATAVAQALGVSLDWLCTGAGSRIRTQATVHAEREEARIEAIEEARAAVLEALDGLRDRHKRVTERAARDLAVEDERRGLDIRRPQLRRHRA